MIEENLPHGRKVTGPVEDDRLVLNYKWNMGWMIFWIT